MAADETDRLRVAETVSVDRMEINTRSPRGVFGTTAASVVAAVLTLLVAGSGCGGDDRVDSEPRIAAPSRHDGLTAAVADAMSSEDRLARAARLATALQGFDQEALAEVEDAWVLAAEDIEGAQTVELALLVDWWARYDPEGALTYLHGRRQHRNPILLTTLVRSWASRDPIAATSAVDALPKSRDPDLPYVIHALAQGWNASGEPGLEAYLIALPSDVARQAAITGLAASKVRRDGVDETIRWAENLIDEGGSDFKLLAFRRVAAAIADVDPVRAAAWAENHRDGPWGAGLVRSVAQNWAQQDGRATMEWLRGLEGGPDVARAFEEGYRSWLGADREVARAWVRDQELDAALDPVVAIYARSTARKDPEAAMPWAERIQDPLLRDETLEKVARAWLHRDPDAARAWLETDELSEDAKNRVYTAHRKAKERAEKAGARKRAAQGN